MRLIEQYQAEFSRQLASGGGSHEISTQNTLAWFASKGKAMYEDAFAHETQILINTTSVKTSLLEQGFPDGWSDYERKAKNETFYKANAKIFLGQVEALDADSPSSPTPDSWQHRYEIIKSLLLGSIALLNDWASHTQQIDDVYNVWRAGVDHPSLIYRGAVALSRGDAGHSPYAAVSLLRAAIELRLRWAFGVLGRIEPNGGVAPIAMSTLLAEVSKQKNNIRFSVDFDHICRLYGWCNIHMHAGLKLYEWLPLFALDYLDPLFSAQPCTTGIRPGVSLHAGIRTTSVVFDAVRGALEPSDGGVMLVRPESCHIVISE
ncbi:MAG: hypothetical protein GC160_26505 [Acidobacteria bacterium]|nr:hypothetical protein [Acidobacteriota bacterium]